MVNHGDTMGMVTNFIVIWGWWRLWRGRCNKSLLVL